MSRYKIVISDYYYPTQDEENRAYAKLADAEIVDLTKLVPGGVLKPEELIPYVRDCDALVVQFAAVTREVIEAMEKCKVIARYAIGVDNIDVKAATERKIYVANVSDYCIDEVANTAAAHILNAVRKISRANEMLKSGSFAMNAVRPLIRLQNATLCLIGFGNIARNLEKKMLPFFRHIVAYDPYFTRAAEYPEVEFLGFEAAVAKADVISIHVPLTDSTRNLLNEAAFAGMKDGVVIVNTARGGVIDENALLAALRSGKVSRAGLDVVATEDFAGSQLLRESHVTLTPHIGWCSEDSVLELQRKVGENVVACLTTGKPNYPVNRW